jgi:hypothetical protein
MPHNTQHHIDMPHNTQHHIEAKPESEQRYFSTRMPRIRLARSANYCLLLRQHFAEGTDKSTKNFKTTDVWVKI